MQPQFYSSRGLNKTNPFKNLTLHLLKNKLSCSDIDKCILSFAKPQNVRVSKSTLTLNSKCKFGNPQDHPQVYNVLELTELSQAILLSVTVYYSKKIQ